MKKITFFALVLVSTFLQAQEIATTEGGRKVILNKNGTYTYTKESITTPATNSSIKGVVSYYFNKYQGDKPDLGASVVVVDSIKANNFDFKLWNNYYFGKSYRSTYSLSKITLDNYTSLYNKAKGDEKLKYQERMEIAQRDVDRYYQDLVKYNCETDEKFKSLDEELFPKLVPFINGKEPYIETTVDNNGNYLINVAPGTYYVYIKSKNRKGITMIDVMGDTYIQKVKVTKNQSKDLSHNFTL
jgi:hypothetical protein